MAYQDAVIYPKISKKAPFSVEAPGYEKKEGETIPRRNVLSKDGLISRPSEDVKTVFDVIKRSSAKFGNAKALGTRKIVKTHTETKKIKKMVDGKEEEVDKNWTYFELSAYSYLSFVEYEQLALALGCGLRKLGMTEGDKMHMYGASSAHWLAMAHSASSQSMPIVTAYDTLGLDGLRHSLLQTKSKAIFLDPALLPTLLKCLKEISSLQFIILNDNSEVKQNALSNLKSDFSHINVLDVNELEKLGKENPVDPIPPQPEDLCCVMYTSGSTGPPKGVLIKHKAVVAAMAGVNAVVGPYIGPKDGLLTYLPQSHILEFMFENLCLFWGGTMGYGSAKTLSDTSVRNCKGDIREFQPTILVGVPQVWETIKKGIIGRVNAGSVIVRSMFWSAMSAKQFLMSTGLPGTFVLDHVVFKKLKEATGGRLRICMNGGGPISKETLRFISFAITPMIQGYGLTETSAMGAIMDPMAWTPDAIGEPPASVEIKLVDFAEAGYFAKNDPPQGEVWIRGDSVTEGYYDNEEETKAAITSDGWFKTGDVGEWDHNGHLKIIDRKKNLVKTQSGEYIALEKLESVYRSTPVVGNICVYAATDQAKPIAIIVPLEPALQKVAAQNGIEGDHEALLHNDKLRSAVLKELQTVGRNGGLVGIEIIDGVVMAEEEWTPESGFTTAAQKIQRKKIVSKYQKEIDRAYGKK